MFHLSQRQHVKSDFKSCSAQSSRRNSRDSSTLTSYSDNSTFEDGKNWLMKQLHLQQQQQQQQYDTPPSSTKSAASNPLSPVISKNALSSVSTQSSVDSVAPTKLHRLNTTNLREYGECYKRLGKGSTAVISICRKTAINGCQAKLYAIKQFRKRNKTESEKEYMKKLTSEFCISSTFCHPNVVETIDLVVNDQNRYCTVMEFCPGGDLFSVIMSEHMTDVEIVCCFKQMIQGLAYLHSVGVAHRDIKPENLLLTLEGKLKITDFGVSDVFRCAWEKNERKSYGLVGSEPYIAPEAFEKGHEYWGSNADIWSAGVVFYSMLRGGHAWIRADQKTDREFRNYLRYWPTQTFPNFKKFPSHIQQLLYKMLDPKPDTRITANQILEDKWIQSIPVCEKGIDFRHREHKHTTLSSCKK